MINVWAGAVSAHRTWTLVVFSDDAVTAAVSSRLQARYTACKQVDMQPIAPTGYLPRPT